MDRRRMSVGLGSMLLVRPAFAQSEPYPSRKVTVIMPTAPGGTADFLARLVGEHLHKTWGQPFVVENVLGATGNVGMRRVARGEPGGYLLALGFTATLSINFALYGKKLPYQADDLAPITQVASVPNAVVVNSKKIGARTVPDLIAYLKANPGKVTFGSAGIGSTQHLTGEMFMQMTDTKMVHVPYRGSGPMVTDLLAGTVDLAFDNVPLLLPHVPTGYLTLLATCTPQRASFDPNLPAVAEFLPGFSSTSWHGFVAPAGTSEAVIDRLSNEIRSFMRLPATVHRLEQLGAVSTAEGPEAFAALMSAETKRWKDVIEAANIKVE